jgi:hypothetical protein
MILEELAAAVVFLGTTVKNRVGLLLREAVTRKDLMHQWPEKVVDFREAAVDRGHMMGAFNQISFEGAAQIVQVRPQIGVVTFQADNSFQQRRNSRRR